MMRDQIALKISKLPFYFADLLLLAGAYFIYKQSANPPGVWSMAAMTVSIAGAAWLSVWPFVLEYRAQVKIAEADALTTAMAQIQKLEAIGGQITAATSQWQTVQEVSAQTANAARQVTEKMATEAKGFAEFMQRMNDTEKANLRLEVDKLRRMEGEWLQVLVRMLDHVYALHQAALRSQQPNVIEQVSHFQSACRDAARRVGLTPFVATESEQFDAQRHQVIEGEREPEGKAVAETLAAGYTFQGRLVRPALVRLQSNGSNEKAQSAEATGADAQSQLPLEAAAIQ